MRRRLLAFSFIALCAGPGWAAPSGVCREKTLARKPGWTLSGAWVSNGAELLVVDPLFQAIWRYTPSGKSLGSFSEPLKSTVRDLSPISVRPNASGLVLEVAGDGFLFLNNRMEPEKTRGVMTKSAQGPYSIGGGLWQWAPVGDEIIAFLDLYPTSLTQGGASPWDPKLLDKWFSGFVRFPANNPAAFRLLQREGRTQVGIQSEERNLLRTGYPYMASIGTTAYILSMDARMSLMKSEAGSDELKLLRSFPAGESDVAPILPRFKEADDYAKTMAQVERESMPVGLYSQGGLLYVLWRKPSPQGARWILSGIDPQKDRLLGSTEIPLKANHVVVVPGEKSWAFIEKGPVKGYGVQDVPRVLFVPATLLQAPMGRTIKCEPDNNQD
jgi:hypothetical protein